MKYCNKCGTKVSADSKFCQDCGAILMVDSSNSPIITDLKVSLTNETNEKILSSVNSAVSSTVTALLNLIPKIIKLVIIILMIGAIGVVIHEIQQETDRKTKEAYWKSKEAEVRKEMAFEAQKAFGTYHISTITKKQIERLASPTAKSIDNPISALVTVVEQFSKRLGKIDKDDKYIVKLSPVLRKGDTETTLRLFNFLYGRLFIIEGYIQTCFYFV